MTDVEKVRAFLVDCDKHEQSAPPMEKFVVPPYMFNNLVGMCRILLDACEKYNGQDLYVIPDDWEFMKNGGGPTFDDCYNLDNYAGDAISKCAKVIDHE